MALGAAGSARCEHQVALSLVVDTLVCTVAQHFLEYLIQSLFALVNLAILIHSHVAIRATTLNHTL